MRFMNLLCNWKIDRYGVLPAYTSVCNAVEYARNTDSYNTDKSEYGNLSDICYRVHDIKNSKRFYNVARWCKWLHLPNFAMMLLPDEMYKCKGKHFTVHIGKPIPWQTFDKTKTPVEWGRWVQDKVYET